MIVRGCNVLVEQHLTGTTSKGGIVLTEQHYLPKGTVVGTGPDVSDLKEGDIVYFVEHAGHRISVGDDILRVLESEDILLILDNKDRKKAS